MDENIFDKINDVDMKKTMETYYIDYAMSVIASRALPDARDGLKPVQRRIIYSMVELNNTPDKPHRKCARIVGDTMGKFHPHGDSSIYEALVKLAQDFSTRYPLIDGHGNFGSVDGDSAAAMRYTEARLSKISMELIADITKDTVDFQQNFDESEKEPTVLPARYPNLLVNGTTGIAVGMATNIPPHNLNESINAIVKIIDNIIENDRETDIEEILEIVKGPDFPTGAKVIGKMGIEQAYRTGKGKIRVRAITEIEEMPNGKNRIIVKELPYMVNKARLIEKIAKLVKDKKIDGITDLRDESDRVGMRICIELRRDVNPNVLLNQLYKHTQMQDTFGVNMLALVNNEPKILNLKEMLLCYLSHQENVVTRRTKYDLNKAKERAHILEGLLKALDNIDKIIQIIRASNNVNIAKENLIKEFNFTEVQATAIVDMRLRTLTGLEREKLESELKELLEKIEYFLEILGNRKKLLSVIKEEITAIKDKFFDERKTIIEADELEMSDEDLIPNVETIISKTNLGYIKRQDPNNFKAQKRGGKGIKGMHTIEEDFIEDLIMTNTHNDILFFTNKGRVYKLKAYQIPESGRTARGIAIVNLLELQKNEKITSIIPIDLKNADEEDSLLMATKNGIVKKTYLDKFKNLRKNGLGAVNLKENDELIGVAKTDGNKVISLITKDGYTISFEEKQVRNQSRMSAGVIGIKLREKDEVISLLVQKTFDENNVEYDKMLLVSENGIGKMTKIEEYKIQSRAGKGLICYKPNERTGKLISAKMVNDDTEIMLITTEGIVIRISCKEITTLGRSATGVKLINLDENVTLATAAKIGKIKEN